VNQPDGATVIDVAAMPWAFTQQHPLDTSSFISEAKKRGFDLDLSTLRELYRHRLLVPFIEITGRPVRAPFTPDEPEPMAGSSRLAEIREARNTGCLRDLSTEPFKRHLRFEQGKQQSRRWWNGFIYSRYQLLALPELKNVLADRTYQKRGTRRFARIQALHPMWVDRLERLRKVILALTALEPRYLPKLDPELVHLINVDVKEWERYREQFDPVEMQEWLQYPAEQVRKDAEYLLSRAHTLDQYGPDWGRLMRRAPAKARKQLTDDALQAMDARIAAEILLLFYEDLAERNQAESLPDFSRVMGWHPLVERLSHRRQTLDEDLVALGISPHPRVVLALEGETEMYHAPRVQAALEFTDAPELIRLLKLGGTSHDLAKLGALAAAPLVSEKIPGTNAWKVIKPYTRLFVAIDPDAPFTSPEAVEQERTKILNEIKDVLRAQGVERPDPAELDHLVELQTWNASCYEFANFTDEELADGIEEVHPTIDGWTRDQLVQALGHWRAKEQDIKRVWTSGRWDDQAKRMTGRWPKPEPSKVELAEALWPTLQRKIERLMSGEQIPAPPIVQVVSDAYHVALGARDVSFVLTELPDNASGQQTGR
jgi:hypothetical protein